MRPRSGPEASNRNLPALNVAAYAMLWLASYQSDPKRHQQGIFEPAKWRTDKRTMEGRHGYVMRNPLLDDLEAAVELLHKSADALGVGPVGEAAIEERFREEGVYRMHCPEPEVLATSFYVVPPMYTRSQPGSSRLPVP